MWLLIPILLYSLAFLYVRHVYTHWQRKGFPSERTSLSWRFLQQVYQREFSHVSAICAAYCMGREQLWGIYCFFRPILLVRDVKLARTILEQANGHFNDSKWDYVKGYKRFNLLEKLAPIFSRPYLEVMHYNVAKVGDHMVSHLEDVIGSSVGHVVELDMQQFLRIYAINVMGNLVYGQDVNNFSQDEHILNKYLASEAQPSSLQSFTLSRLPKKSSLTYRLRDLIKTGTEQREEGGLIRKDILQLLIKFRNGDELQHNAEKLNWHVEHFFEHDKLLSVKRLARIAEYLLKLSLDTIAATTTLTLYEILNEPLIAKRIREEIKQLNNDDAATPKALNYAHLESMKYMDMCIMETLRKYPPIPIIERVCRKSYTLPNSRFTIVEGKTIMVPLLAIQRDAQYFAEPLQYKPTRFLRDVNEGAHAAFFGFGLGSGQCIARNFSKMVIKSALIKLLHNFDLTLSSAVPPQVVHQPSPFISTKEGLRVKLKNPQIKTKFYI